MRGRCPSPAVLALVAAAMGCSGPPVPLVSVPSPAPKSEVPQFRAGFGRADITPPPGVGLAGNGPEGREARGYRLRLYARALVLEDAAGSRLALVAVDMPHTSLLLHRRVAQRLLAAGTRIGSDRLLLSATHTHSGPGHHYEAGHFNEENSEVKGYDPALTDSLAERIAQAVRQAVDRRQPARVAWGTREVWGYTRIRSMPARERNMPPPARIGTPPPGLPPAEAAIDPRFTMLRVDLLDSATGRFLPAGAYSIFAVHGTGNSAETELFDADVHGIVERGLERHVDSLRVREGGATGTAVHVFANGTEGDTSPGWTADSRCPTPVLRPREGPGGPFATRVWDWRRVSPAASSGCITSARRALEHVGAGIAAAAGALFDSLAPAPVTWSLERAFRTVDFRTEGESLGVCREAFTGTSTVGGGPDARTRIYGLRVLGLFNAGFEEGDAASDPDRAGCHGAKRVLLGPAIERLFVSKGLPRYGQFGVYRIGDMLIAGVPAEVTTEAGQRIERALRGAVDTATGWTPEARVVSIANGFIYYLTTAEEYTAQMYEGGSTLFGPGSSAMVASVTAGLVPRLSADSLPMAADTVIAKPGPHARVMPRVSPREPAADGSLEEPTCSGDTVIARFTHGRRGDWLPDGPVLTFAPTARPDSVIAAGDDPGVEVWEVGRRGGLVRWEARWVPASHGSWTVTLHVPAESSRSVSC